MEVSVPVQPPRGEASIPRAGCRSTSPLPVLTSSFSSPLQGRMLHVLPSTVKKEASEDADAPGSSSYKKKKESKDKANSSRSLPSSDPDFPVLVPPLLAPWAPGSSW